MRTGSFTRHLLMLIVCLAGLACASAGAAAGDAAARDVRPRLRPDSPPLALHFTVAAVVSGSPSAAARTSMPRPDIRLNVEVEVDELGNADVGTLKVFGTGAVEHRSSILSWLREARFEPARRDGVAVRGVYKMTIDPSRGGTR